MTSVKLDLDAADLRISRGSVPASTQLAEALKAQIIQQRLPRGGRLPSERELIDRSGLSRVTVRAAVGMLQRQGWLVRRQGLGTFVADPVEQELSCGVRTTTEVLLSCGVTPQVDVLSHQTGPAPQRISETLGLVEVLCIRRRIRTGDQPWPWSRPIFRPAWAQPSSRCYRAARTPKPHMRCGSGDWVYALHRLPTKSMPPGPPRRSRRVGSGGGFAGTGRRPHQLHQ